MTMSVRELLAAAEAHDGQEVEVLGTLRTGREELSIGDEDDEGPRIWLSLRGGNPDARGRLAHNKRAIARGVFRIGPTGHLERFPGELDPVHEVERVRGRRTEP